MTSKEIKSGLDNGEARNPSPASGSLWSTWSERVEGVRGLRFSLDGTIVENDLVQVADTVSLLVIYFVHRVAERDFLRTEGDPGAAGYTIKEAVALTRSVIPGQRALALHILLAILDKAVHNIFQGQVGCSIGNDDKDNKFTDWEAIWAYALGPEPELVLSLRICLDDNHNSVVLVCAKVIQCILTCDVNESFFNFSEKITLKDICTAPVFQT
ncbi:hypothetical protein L484_022891 [Morus notabilis]|uniref:RPAP1 C-terminal domain-containing protein n=1 Tax=Morus notabilis TaxID=981085 RepID=W9RK37_9ROSA|nr:hypothetical protein L484_022891 [Morus notabilis]